MAQPLQECRGEQDLEAGGRQRAEAKVGVGAFLERAAQCHGRLPALREPGHQDARIQLATTAGRQCAGRAQQVDRGGGLGGGVEVGVLAGADAQAEVVRRHRREAGRGAHQPNQAAVALVGDRGSVQLGHGGAMPVGDHAQAAVRAAWQHHQAAGGGGRAVHGDGAVDQAVGVHAVADRRGPGAEADLLQLAGELLGLQRGDRDGGQQGATVGGWRALSDRRQAGSLANPRWRYLHQPNLAAAIGAAGARRALMEGPRSSGRAGRGWGTGRAASRAGTC